MTDDRSPTQPLAASRPGTPHPDCPAPHPSPPPASRAPTFIHLHDTLVSSGLLAQLSGSAFKVLAVLGLAASPLGPGAFFRDLLAAGIFTPADRGRLFCGLRHHEIARRAGLGKNTVTRATAQLQALGLVEKRVVARPDGTRYNLFFLLPASHLDKFNTLRPAPSSSPARLPKTGTAPRAVPVPPSGTNDRKGLTTTATAPPPAVNHKLDPRALLAHFARRQGLARYRPTAHDRRKLDLLASRGYSQPQVLAAIDRAFDRRLADAPPIRMFSYCATIALAAPPDPAPLPPADPRPPVTATGTRPPHGGASAPPPALPLGPLPPRLAALYESEIGPLSPLVRSELASLAAAHPDPAEWDAAFREAVRANVRRISYVHKVLQGRQARRSARRETQPSAPRADPCPDRHPQPSTPPGGNHEETRGPGRDPSAGWAEPPSGGRNRYVNWHDCTAEQLLAIQRAAAAVQPLDPAQVLGHGR